MLSRTQLNKLADALQGIAVWGCLSGSRAQRAGIGYGDILLWVNGVRTSNMDEYLHARSLRDDVIQLVVFRGGAEVSLDIELDPDRRAPTRAELTDVVAEVVASRLVPTEHPPPPDEDQI